MRASGTNVDEMTLKKWSDIAGFIAFSRRRNPRFKEGDFCKGQGVRAGASFTSNGIPSAFEGQFS
jgi:hypothetical protein